MQQLPPLKQEVAAVSDSPPLAPHRNSSHLPVPPQPLVQLLPPKQEPQQETSVIQESNVAAVCPMVTPPEPPVVSFLGEADHLAKPTRRFIPLRVPIPDQSTGSMRVSAPAEGQALAKTPKENSQCVKARAPAPETTKEEETTSLEVEIAQ